MIRVTIESKIADCDKEVTAVAGQMEKIIGLVEKTNDPGLALSIVVDRLSELRTRVLGLDFQNSGILE